MQPMQEAGEPIVRLGPEEAETPLVLAVPHSGRTYPPSLLADSAVDRTVLEQLEDRFADQLIAQAVSTGAVAIVAKTARAWIDLNRAPDEIDPAMAGSGERIRPGARVRSGLGLIPRRLGRSELLRRLPDPSEIQARIDQVHTPYHRMIGEALYAARQRHGVAVLLDCHSMPPIRAANPARVVLGDRHGRSCARHIVEAALGAARARGFPTALNAPYSGAYTLDRHGRPSADVHALQIEIDRTLYLNRGTPGTRSAAVCALIAEVGWAAVDAAIRLPSLAAE